MEHAPAPDMVEERAHPVTEDGSTVDGGQLAVGVAPHGLSAALGGPATLMRLQRRVGNAAVGALLRRANANVQRDPTVPPAPGGNLCAQLLGAIISLLEGGISHVLGGKTFTSSGEIKRGVIERFNDMLVDKADLFNKYRFKSNPGPNGLGSWEGHQEAFEGQQRGLRNRLNDWIKSKCDDPSSGLPQEAKDVHDQAMEWATKPTPQKPNAKPTTPPGSSKVSWSDVLKVLTILGLSLALAAGIVAALADPEPGSKIALAVGDAELAGVILTMLGLSQKLDPATVASQGNYPEEAAVDVELSQVVA